MTTASRAAPLGVRQTARLCNPPRVQEDVMEIDKQKVDEMTLALLYLTTFKDKHGLRAWKSHDWDVLNRLHESGYIDDPVSKAKSVMLTEEGAEGSKRLFEKHFMTD
jgi:hypothetical protein